MVRIRPPLPRELPHKGERDEHGLGLKFLSVADIAEDQKTCSMMEYLGAEVSEHGRQKDIANNPQMVTYH